MKYHHVGVPTNTPRAGETYLREHHLYVSGFDESPYGIEWMRFEPGCTLPDIVKGVPHVAFVVEDLSAAIVGKEVLIPPNRPSDGVTVAFIVDNGAPVEFLQFDGPEHEVWPGCAPPGEQADLGPAACIETERDVLSSWDAIRRAMLANDTGILEARIAPDYEGCGADGRLHDRSQLLMAYSPGVVTLENFDVTDLRVRVFGRTATVTGSACMVGSYAGGRFKHVARFLDVFIERESVWLLTASQTTDIRPPGPDDSSGGCS
jgi:hypothetical protein